MLHSFDFWAGVVLGGGAIGVLVGIYYNNIHSAKLKSIENKVDTVVTAVKTGVNSATQKG